MSASSCAWPTMRSVRPSHSLDAFPCTPNPSLSGGRSPLERGYGVNPTVMMLNLLASDGNAPKPNTMVRPLEWMGTVHCGGTVRLCGSGVFAVVRHGTIRHILAETGLKKEARHNYSD